MTTLLDSIEEGIKKRNDQKLSDQG